MANLYGITFLALVAVSSLAGFVVGYVAGRENPPQTEVNSPLTKGDTSC